MSGLYVLVKVQLAVVFLAPRLFKMAKLLTKVVFSAGFCAVVLHDDDTVPGQ